CIELVRDGVADLAHQTTPKGTIMLVVASAALVVNGLSAWLLHGAMHVHLHSHHHAPERHDAHDHDHDHDHEHEHEHGHASDAHGEGSDESEGHPAPEHAHHLNIRGAWLHLLGDALGS